MYSSSTKMTKFEFLAVLNFAKEAANNKIFIIFTSN